MRMKSAVAATASAVVIGLGLGVGVVPVGAVPVGVVKQNAPERAELIDQLNRERPIREIVWGLPLKHIEHTPAAWVLAVAGFSELAIDEARPAEGAAVSASYVKRLDGAVEHLPKMDAFVAEQEALLARVDAVIANPPRPLSEEERLQLAAQAAVEVSADGWWRDDFARLEGAHVYTATLPATMPEERTAQWWASVPYNVAKAFGWDIYNAVGRIDLAFAADGSLVATGVFTRDPQAKEGATVPHGALELLSTGPIDRQIPTRQLNMVTLDPARAKELHEQLHLIHWAAEIREDIETVEGSRARLWGIVTSELGLDEGASLADAKKATAKLQQELSRQEEQPEGSSLSSVAVVGIVVAVTATLVAIGGGIFAAAWNDPALRALLPL